MAEQQLCSPPSFFFPLCSSKKPLLAALASNFAAQRCRSKAAAPASPRSVGSLFYKAQ
uniref:Uncharacterized protein n=1 Tax=Zea mays TaxID=4577 RepID=B6T5D5_MAIZE|nr:hypothetical protein [Zea mays]